MKATASHAFSPSAPIDEADLFAGRTVQITKALHIIGQRGQHGIVFGERGVGKTSFANVLSEFLQPETPAGILAPRINCDSFDSYSSVWRKVFARLEIQRENRPIGYRSETSTRNETALDSLNGEDITPDQVQHVLSGVADQNVVIVILDEFDRLEQTKTRRLLADTIKSLSDHSIPATILLVGVADSVGHLISEHHSVERALVQIPMPRMSKSELDQIIHKSLDRINQELDKKGFKISISSDALDYISGLSQGLPHYTHLVGLHATHAAIDAGSPRIEVAHVLSGIKVALDEAQQTTRESYHNATVSPRKENLYAQALLACALANTDEFGYFYSADVREPMSMIMCKRYDIPSFSKHLKDFSEGKRGPILQKSGEKHSYRFRFVNPLMQPYVVMRGIADGRILAQYFMELIKARLTPKLNDSSFSI